MQGIRIVELNKCKMISSGVGMFGEKKFDMFSEFLSNIPRTNHPNDFLFWDKTGFHWLYVYQEGMTYPSEFELIDFEGGLYAVTTDIDQQTNKELLDRDVVEFLKTVGFEIDNSRPCLGNVITSPHAREIMGYNQMDYYYPIKKSGK